MKRVIKPEKQNVTGSTASSTDAEWPLANLFDKHPRNWWQASATNEATLRLKIDAGSSALALFGTNADEVNCYITRDADEQNIDINSAVDDSSGFVGIPLTGHNYVDGTFIYIYGTTNYNGTYTVEVGSTVDLILIDATYAAESFDGSEIVVEIQEQEEFDLQVVDDYLKFTTGEAVVYRQFFMQYTYENEACTANIELTSVVGSTVRAGSFIAGINYEITAPLLGMEETREDFSVVQRTNNASRYTRKRNIIKKFSGEFYLNTDYDFPEFMSLYEYFGPDPFACLLADRDSRLFALYACFTQPPRGIYVDGEVNSVSFSIEEVI